MTQICKTLEDIPIPIRSIRTDKTTEDLTKCRITDIYLRKNKDKPIVYIMFRLMTSIEDKLYEAEVGVPVVFNIYNVSHYIDILKEYMNTSGLIWGRSQKSRIPRKDQYMEHLNINECLLSTIERGHIMYSEEQEEYTHE